MDRVQEDIRLMREIAHGSKSAFQNLYEMYSSFVYRIAYQVVRNQEEAEDICHDVFLEVYQKTGEYKPTKGSVRAWLAVKTKSRSIDRLRKKKPLLVQKLEYVATHQEEPADALVFSQLERQHLLKALKALPKEQQHAIYASYFLGQTHHELARSMNKPLGSVKSFIRYGLNNLRKQKTILNWSKSSGGEEKSEF
ncbi:sigma-70 family RNA polymerase sigma factor [Radiobacillus kanasensis]|uniref:RNA polymerase sigma factor n=1 Tax=Radiobacillus kanasensis TaxID=2844358 RepID=UPI001E2EE967|nr:sigma-70 family RNA polymerase sigma factor [Radiobacillus kanasensis]UFT98694.1 sigma-70 family RNA polymerase sigma factor [Radiobacillus kanasensis]